jgi:hypothetical protein
MEQILAFIVGTVIGAWLTWGHARARASKELLETYRHLIDYGRTSKPVATVTEHPGTVEDIASIRISERATENLTDYLAKEAGVSTERARAEAEELVAQYETAGQIPSS